MSGIKFEVCDIGDESTMWSASCHFSVHKEEVQERQTLALGCGFVTGIRVRVRATDVLVLYVQRVALSESVM